MTQPTHIAAADWVARLSGEPGEADWLGFEAWLQAAPGNRGAYDRAAALWLDLDDQAAPLAALIADEDGVPPGQSTRTRRQGPTLWWSAGMSAVAVAAVTIAALNPNRPTQPDLYATAKGERREIILSDGTHVALNTGSSISVRMQRGSREITLAQGEAAFQVVHDASRPFVVHAGDRVMRDVGTDFDVARNDGLITVTVREGMVAVQRSSDDTRSLSLGPGSRLVHREGAAQSTVLAANTDEAFSWRSGRLVYRDRPLADIVADLNRYGEDQIKVDAAAARLRFSGVLTIDNQPAMVARLSALLPVSAARKDGVVTLRELDNSQ